MRTARISDLGRGHLRTEFVPKLRVESFHRSDSEGYTIVTIERHSPDRFSTGPYIYVYMCPPRARGLAPSRVFLPYRTDNRLPTRPRTAPFWVSAEVLANDNAGFQVHFEDSKPEQVRFAERWVHSRISWACCFGGRQEDSCGAANLETAGPS